MARRGRLVKVGMIILAAFILAIISILFFPVQKPHVVLPPDAIFHIGGFPIYNTLLASWLAILVLVLLFYLGTRRMKLIPRGWQNAIEAVYEAIYNFVEGAAGSENARRFLPVVATIFLYVIAAAFTSLLPGFDTIGFGHGGEQSAAFGGTYNGWIVEEPLLRKANTDINFPLALALISFLFVEYCGIRALGVRHYVSKFIRVGQVFNSMGQLVRGKVRGGLSGLFSGFIDVFVGTLEAISEFVRIISFTFRLFGNMTAGMVLLLLIGFLIPWVVAVPFYGLEMLFGFVQALIFAGLTLIFAIIAVKPHSEGQE
jgi:F-type H+-transporting ATPase subunit a